MSLSLDSISQKSSSPSPSLYQDSAPGSASAFASDNDSSEDFNDEDIFGSRADIIQDLKTVGLLSHHQMSSKLCRYCANITYEALCSPKGYRHTPNIWKFLQSAKDCELCAGVMEKINARGNFLLGFDSSRGKLQNRPIEGFEYALLDRGIDRDVTLPAMVRLDSPGLIFNVEGAYETDWLASFEVFTDSSKHALVPLSCLPLHLAPTDKPNLALLSRLVGMWMAQCRQSSTICNFPSQEDVIPRLPTRVIDLREVKAMGSVRVWHTQGSRAQYIALSHRWGGKQPVMTEMGNLSQRMKGFSYADLPLLFRDAVDTTLALGIDYLWIDSLCIIQDDKNDWAIEAANMADIYMNSALTIAASAAPNSSGSLLGSRAIKPKVVQIRQQADSDTEEDWSLYVNVGQTCSFQNDAHLSPLNKRAWVLQERLLSPRTLFFTQTQVYWECWCHVQNETLTKEWGAYSKENLFPCSLTPGMAGERITFSDFLLQWSKVVEMYTSCQLTFASDKLVAIDGIVSRLKAENANPYFKGVFLEALHEQLLWVTNDNTCSGLLSEVDVPSWSWASRDGAIRFAVPYPNTLTPNQTTFVVERDHPEEQLWDLRADLYTLDKNLLVGELRKKGRDDVYYRKKRRIQEGLLLGDGDIHFRFVHEDSTTVHEGNNTDDESDRSDFVPHFTGYEDESNFEDDDTVAGAVLDYKTGDEPSFESIFWVLVGYLSQNRGKRKEYYCILVRENDESKYVRIGIGLLFDKKWLHLYRSGIIIS